MESFSSLRLDTLRLLLDENFPKLAVDALQRAGHDVVWIRTHSPGITDKDILRFAERDHRIQTVRFPNLKE